MPAATPYLGINFLSNYALHTFRAAVQLRPNVSFGAAQSEADIIGKRIEEAQPKTHHGRTIRLMPAREFFFLNTRRPVGVLFGGALLVVILGAVNLANIFIVDGLRRANEFAIRAALGAASRQLASSLLVGAMTPLLLGGGAGFGLAAVLIEIFNRVGTFAFPDFAHVGMSAGVLLVGLALLGFVISVAALAPVLWARTIDLRSGLQSGSKGAGETGAAYKRHLLISVEVALATALLVGTGLTARSLFEMMRLKTGYNSSRLLTFQLQLDRNRLQTREERIGFARQITESLQNGPGIETAFLWGPSMLSHAGWTFDVTPADRNVNDPSSSLNVQHLDTIPGGLGRLGIPLLSGRDFSIGSLPAYPLEAIIDQEAARRLWPGLDPIGRRMYLFHDPARPMIVIGLVPHVLNRGGAFDDTRLLTGDVYVSSYQLGPERITVLIRYRDRQAEPVMAWSRAQLARLDPTLAPFNVATMDERLGREAEGPRFTATLFGIYAAIALLLTVVGIYGVLAFSIVQRTREFGVRLAVGASRTQVIALVLRQAMTWIGIGLGVGLVLALYGAALLDGLLIGVTSQDTTVFCGTMGVILLSGLVATSVPAIRAARVDPLIALRAE
jgi:predicted permease